MNGAPNGDRNPGRGRQAGAQWRRDDLDHRDRDAHRDRLAGVLDDYLAALEQGEWPTLQELAAAHPDLADELPDYLEGLHLIHGALAEPLLADGEAPAAPDCTAVFRERASPRARGGARRRVGDFELLSEIGRGGMGIVYEAWQRSLKRRVALKVLPFAATLDERQAARFVAEAQAAAGLDHQNIVPVHSVGHDQGVHYYAMRMVSGHSLAEAIAQMRAAGKFGVGAGASDLPPADPPAAKPRREQSRLGLIEGEAYFRAVARIGVMAARALDHAHQYGVVHRDIKPANLLLDRRGKLWVTDFGLARVQSEASTTTPGDLVGSLRYMSPEQARGRGDLIDCRTDVYGLGATLYELITLRAAHAGQDREDLLQKVYYEAPPARRSVNPATPPDLENVVLKAMAKARDDRYATAQCLADDLRRYLDRKPTIAKRPSAYDRLSKWVARRQGVALSAAAALILVTAVSLVSSVWVAAALTEARSNQALAESHFEQARDVVDRFGGDLADRLAALPGAEPLRRELLNDTLVYYQQFLLTIGENDGLQRDLAATLFKSGVIAERLGDQGTARGYYTRAVRVWRRLHANQAAQGAPGPGGNELELELGLGLGALARISGELGHTHDAEALFGEALSLLRVTDAGAGSEASRANALAETLSNYGLMLRRDGRTEEATAHLSESIEWIDRARTSRPQDPLYLRNRAIARSNLGEALCASDPAAAADVCREAENDMRLLTARFPGNDRYLADLAMTCNNSAGIFAGRQEWAGALEGYEEASEILMLLHKRHAEIPEYRRELAITRCNMGVALARLGDPLESDAVFEVAKVLLAGLIGEFPDRLAYQTDMANLWSDRAAAFEAGRRDHEAFHAYGKSVEAHELVAEQRGVSVDQAPTLDRRHENHAELFRSAGSVREQHAIEARRANLLWAQPDAGPAPADAPR